MFRLADPDTSRKVIQVTNKQGTESFAMLHTMPSYRNNRVMDSEIRFLETPAGAPRAVSTWWYVGDSIGYQFIWSKEQLAALNRVAQPEPVAAVSEESSAVAEGEPVKVPPIEEPVTSPNVVEGDGVPPEAESEGQIAQAQPPAQPQVDQSAPAPSPAPEQVSPQREELPSTASPLALVLLAGLATGTLGLQLLRKS
jgi:hypothetical protein